MRFIFLGTGSAFTDKNYHSNTLLQQNGKNLLIDAGSDLRHALRKAGLTYLNINGGFITHLHDDHAGGVEYLGFTTYFDPRYTGKMVLYGYHETLMQGWDHKWKGGLGSIQGKVMTLEDYFDVKMLRMNESFIWEGVHFQIVQTVHIMNGYSIVPTYGLIITCPDTGKKIYFTSDTQHCPNQIQDFYNMCDIIIHDCETAPYKSGVHAHYSDLLTLSAETKKKMYLQHYMDNILLEEDVIDPVWVERAHADGFKGFLTRGRIIDTESM